MKAALLFVTLLTVCGQAESDRATRWREDLLFFSEHFPAAHLDFAKLWTPRAFQTEIQALQESAAELPDAEIMLRMTRLVASGNVAHTRVNWPLFDMFHRLPLTLRWFADGLAVVQAAPKYQAALGTRVLRVGSMTPEQLLAAAAAYISHENESFLRSDFNTGYLTVLELLQEIGAAPRGEGALVEFQLAKPGGEPFTLAVGAADPREWKLVSLFDGTMGEAPLYRKNRDHNYWFEYLPESKALYLQYNRCQNDPKLEFSEFSQQLFHVLDTSAVERVIVDLRFNGGGNSSVMRPLTEGLRSRRGLRPRVSVLVGRNTFSSALMNALELRREVQAIWVGEEPGERPHSYGEVRPLSLPHAGITIQYCTKFFRLGKDVALEPDIRVSGSLEDALAGRDPVLDAGLKTRGRP